MIAVKAALLETGVRFEYSEVARSLGLSRSEAHAGALRCLQARLLVNRPEMVRPYPVANRTNLLEFLIHGVKYAFPPVHGGMARGVPTGHAAPVLRKYFAESEALPPVWPDPMGIVRGRAFEPLYRSAPKAASLDPSMYEALALIDAIRGGRARDREIAERLLGDVLMQSRDRHHEHQPRST
jgi:hypothetical protein